MRNKPWQPYPAKDFQVFHRYFNSFSKTIPGCPVEAFLEVPGKPTAIRITKRDNGWTTDITMFWGEFAHVEMELVRKPDGTLTCQYRRNHVSDVTLNKAREVADDAATPPYLKRGIAAIEGFLDEK